VILVKAEYSIFISSEPYSLVLVFMDGVEMVGAAEFVQVIDRTCGHVDHIYFVYAQP
jgi:hypothetical protein